MEKKAWHKGLAVKGDTYNKIKALKRATNLPIWFIIEQAVDLYVKNKSK